MAAARGAIVGDATGAIAGDATGALTGDAPTGRATGGSVGGAGASARDGGAAIAAAAPPPPAAALTSAPAAGALTSAQPPAHDFGGDGRWGDGFVDRASGLGERGSFQLPWDLARGVRSRNLTLFGWVIALPLIPPAASLAKGDPVASA